MRVTVIAPDKLVLVDGEALELPDFDFDPKFHAMQLDGSSGHIEFLTNDGGLMTAPISEYELQPYIEAWKVEKERINIEQQRLRDEAEARTRIRIKEEPIMFLD